MHGKTYFPFGNFSLGISSECFFYVSVDFLDDELTKLSCAGCLHGLMLVEVFHAVACGKYYAINCVLLITKIVFVYEIMVVIVRFV